MSVQFYTITSNVRGFQLFYISCIAEKGKSTWKWPEPWVQCIREEHMTCHDQWAEGVLAGELESLLSWDPKISDMASERQFLSGKQWESYWKIWRRGARTIRSPLSAAKRWVRPGTSQWGLWDIGPGERWQKPGLPEEGKEWRGCLHLVLFRGSCWDITGHKMRKNTTVRDNTIADSI